METVKTISEEWTGLLWETTEWQKELNKANGVTKRDGAQFFYHNKLNNYITTTFTLWLEKRGPVE